jgi:hypothetical protein
LHNALSLIILNILKKRLVTVEEEDVPYASTVINFKNAQVNTSLDLALGYLAKKKFINLEILSY